MLNDKGWTNVTARGTPPCPRDGHSAVLAPDNHTIFVFGGFDGTTQLSDLWALDTRNFEWRELKPEGASPPARCMHSAQMVHGQMIIFGGYAFGADVDDDELHDASTPLAGDDVRFDDAWVLRIQVGSEKSEVIIATDNTQISDAVNFAWQQIQWVGDAPPALFAAASTVDEAGRVWFHGGCSGSTCSDALFMLASVPSSNLAELTVNEDVHARSIGGHEIVDEQSDESEQVADRCEGNFWKCVKVPSMGTTPSARHKHNLVATQDGRIILFGGTNRGFERGLFSLDISMALKYSEIGSGNSVIESVLLGIAQYVGIALTLLGLVLKRIAYSRMGLAICLVVALVSEPRAKKVLVPGTNLVLLPWIRRDFQSLIRRTRVVRLPRQKIPT